VLTIETLIDRPDEVIDKTHYTNPAYLHILDAAMVYAIES